MIHRHFMLSHLAVLVEKAARRTELTVYVANQAAEGIYHSLAARGLAPIISGGTEILYSLSFACLIWFMKNRPELVPNSVKVLLDVFVGNEEKADVAEKLVGKLYKKWRNLVGDAVPSLFSAGTSCSLCTPAQYLIFH